MTFTERTADPPSQDTTAASFLTEAGGHGSLTENHLSFLLHKPASGPLSRIDAEFKWENLIQQADWPVFRQAFTHCMTTGDALDVTCNLVDIAPTPIRTSIIGKLMHDASGNPSWIEGVMTPARDLHACSGCREAVVEAEKKAKEFSRNILAVLSHDMRSPLIGVMGMIQLLRKSGLTPQQQEYATRASDACEIVLELAKNLLDFAKIESGKDSLRLQALNLSAIARSMAELHSEQARRSSIALAVRTSRGFPKAVLCDEVKFRQVLGNLLSNAIKFTASGSVKLHLSHVRKPGGGITAIIDVADTGIGFDPADARFMFDQFSQMCQEGHLRRKGAGLGLTIVKGVVDLFGGSICVNSTKGKGSSFIVSLPLEVPG